MATPTIVQTGGIGGTTTPISATLATTPALGSQVVAIVASDTTMTSGPAGFTARTSDVSNQGAYTYDRFITQTTGFNPVTVTPNGANPASIACVELASTSGFDVSSATATRTQDTGHLAQVCASVTPTADGIVLAVVCLHGMNSGGAATGFAWTNGFTHLYASPLANSTGNNGNLNAMVAIGYKLTTAGTATGATTVSWTNVARDSVGWQMAYKGGPTNPALILTGAANVNTQVSQNKVLTITKPSGLVDNQLMVAYIGCGAVSATAMAEPSGWTRVFTNSPANTGGVYTKWVTTASAEPANYTWTVTTTEGGASAGLGGIIALGYGFDAASATPRAMSAEVVISGSTGTTFTVPAVSGISVGDVSLKCTFLWGANRPTIVGIGGSLTSVGAANAAYTKGIVVYEWQEQASATTTSTSRVVTYTANTTPGTTGTAVNIILKPAAPPVTRTGQPKIWNGTAWVNKPFKVWNGTAWVTKPIKFWDGSSWVLAK